MHEFDIMHGVIRLLQQAAQENNIKNIAKVQLVVGKFAGVLPDALQMAFSIYKNTLSSLMGNAVLEITECDIICRCTNCSNTFSVRNSIFVCPCCNSTSNTIISGRELYLHYFEGE